MPGTQMKVPWVGMLLPSDAQPPVPHELRSVHIVATGITGHRTSAPSDMDGANRCAQRIISTS
jgi:hypothetical protein